jgi:hypothetical protein
MASELREYLLREEPLVSCARCRGGNAELQPHRQLTQLELQAAAEALR